MSNFKLPELPDSVPVPVKKPPVKLGAAQPAKPAAQPRSPVQAKAAPAVPEMPDRSWDTSHSSPAGLAASDLLAGDREVWAKGIMLSIILGKPRCKSRGWR